MSIVSCIVVCRVSTGEMRDTLASLSARLRTSALLAHESPGQPGGYEAALLLLDTQAQSVRMVGELGAVTAGSSGVAGTSMVSQAELSQSRPPSAIAKYKLSNRGLSLCSSS